MKIKLTFLLILFCAFSFAQNEFITLWKPSNPSTTNPVSSDTQIYFSGDGTNYKIYWEEVGNPSHNGTLNNVNTVSERKLIDFGTGLSPDATYIVKVSNGNGIFSSFSGGFGDTEKLIEVKQWGNIKWQSMTNAFGNCKNMDVTATDIPDLTLVTRMDGMFYECFGLKGNSTFGLWDTSNVTDMSFLFAFAVKFNQNIGNWNTSKVTSMEAMFEGLIPNPGNFDQYIGNWDTSNVKDMQWMFFSSKFNQNIGNWNTSKVTNMSYMFYYSLFFDQDLGKWNLKSINKINNFFNNAPLSCQNYNKTLIGWANSPETPNNLQFVDNYYVKYSSPEAVTARNYLKNTKGWTITGDSYNPSCGLATNELDIKKTQVYPNPAKDFISIKNLKSDVDLEIYDMQGKLVKREKYKNSQFSIKNLSKGIYILKVPSENYSQKLIVE